MTELQKLHERKLQLVGEIRKMADKASDTSQQWTSDDEARWKNLNDEHDDIATRIQRLERAQSLEGDHRSRDPQDFGSRGGDVLFPQFGADPRRQQPGEGGEPRVDSDDPEERARARPAEQNHALAIQAWFRCQLYKELNEDHVAACRAVRLHPRTPELNLTRIDDEGYIGFRSQYLRETRANTSAGSGGETIPTGFVNRFERALLRFGGMRRVSQILRTASGNDLHYPTNDDTSNKGRYLAEEGAVTETDVTTADLVFGAHKASSDLVKVSAELLEDNAVDLANRLADMLGERIGRIENEKFTVGTGTGEPNGVVTASPQGVVAASNSTISADEIIDLIHSIDPAYRDQSILMLHDSTVQVIRKLKDSNNNYLWEPRAQDGTPPKIFGVPIVVNQDVPTISGSAKTVLCGDFSKYIIRDAGSLRMYRLVERFRDNDQEGFVSFVRNDGDLLDAGTGPIKHLVQAV